MKKKILNTLLSFVFAAILLPLTASAQDINWQKYDTGMAMAGEQNKKIFIYFHAEWCSYCTKMEKTTFKNSSVIDYINNNFVAIKVDSDREQEVSREYYVRGLPALWFLESDHTKITTLPGYVDANTFDSILKFINTESYDKMSYKDFKKTL
ncbi:MAG: thioredoxin family protein [Desulfobacterium sp.]|jgi:thioredoxin-related protein|nr:thioredoxin family protein [Desulfobacterium sp.]